MVSKEKVYFKINEVFDNNINIAHQLRNKNLMGVLVGTKKELIEALDGIIW